MNVPLQSQSKILGTLLIFWASTVQSPCPLSKLLKAQFRKAWAIFYFVKGEVGYRVINQVSQLLCPGLKEGTMLLEFGQLKTLWKQRICALGPYYFCITNDNQDLIMWMLYPIMGFSGKIVGKFGEKKCCKRNMVYSGSSPNGHSQKQTALLTTAFTKPSLSQLPYKLCIFTIL